MDDNGLTTIESGFPVGETADRLVNVVTAAGLRIFGRVDHGAGAAEVGMPLRPTELVIFGHPKGGTPLMQDNQTVGIDLPVKALIWQDEVGKVWLTYNETAWIAQRHALGSRSEADVAVLQAGLEKVVQAACAD